VERAAASARSGASSCTAGNRWLSAAIPLCDAYFNFLLEQRALLADELRRLEEAVAESVASDDPRAVLDAFIESLRTEVGPA
jgi:hypothetical protein